MVDLDVIFSEMESRSTPDDSVLCVIDDNLRIVTVPSSGMVFGVEKDKDVNKIDFEMDRYYRDNDMSEFSARIYYQNAKGNKNYSTVTDLSFTEDKITFSWTVPAYALMYEGTIRFAVNFIKTSGSVVEKAFNTTIALANCLIGLYIDTQIPEKEFEDYLTHLKNEIKGYSDVQLAAIEDAKTEALIGIDDAEEEALSNIKQASPALPVITDSDFGKAVTVKSDASGLELSGPYAPIEVAVRPTVSGNPAVAEDSIAWKFQGLAIYGKSTQDGTPSPENPVPIVSAGDGGSVDASLSGINMMNYFLVKDYGTIRNCNISLDGNVFVFTAKADGNSYFGGHILIKSGETYPEKSKKLLFPVTPGEKLKIVVSNSYFKTPAFCFVKKDFTVISFSGGSFSITVPEDAAYATARLGNASAKVSDGTQYTTFMVCREEYNDNFVPYQDAQTLSISTPNGLPGVPVESGGNFTDVDGQQLVCDVKDYGAGKYTQNYAKVVFDGSEDENWALESVTTPTLIRFSIKIGNVALYPSGLCNRLPWTIVPVTGSQTEQIGGNGSAQRIHVIVSKSRLNDATVSGFKAWLASNPLEVIYQLATPIETDIPAEELAAYRALQTYTGTTVVSTAEPVAGIEVSYVADTQKYIDKKIEEAISKLNAAQQGEETNVSL